MHILLDSASAGQPWQSHNQLSGISYDTQESGQRIYFFGLNKKLPGLWVFAIVPDKHTTIGATAKNKMTFGTFQYTSW